MPSVAQRYEISVNRRSLGHGNCPKGSPAESNRSFDAATPLAGRTMRICTDGFVDLRDQRRVRMPGDHRLNVEPMPNRQALEFLLSHSFRGHRKVVRTLTKVHRTRLHLAMWANSVNERMSLIDRVWREITEPVLAPADFSEPHLVQILRIGPDWEFQLYLADDTTRVIPPGGEASWRIRHPEGVHVLDMDPAATS